MYTQSLYFTLIKATNAPGRPCATVAKDLLAEGGSAVDAAVGALVCNGLYNPQVSISENKHHTLRPKGKS